MSTRSSAEKQAAWMNKRLEKDPFYRRRVLLRSRHNMELEEFNEMLELQKGACAICGTPSKLEKGKGGLKDLAVDHSHVTGQIRGLLCSQCNQGLGRFKDNVENLKRAIEYLEKHAVVKLRAVIEADTLLEELISK